MKAWILPIIQVVSRAVVDIARLIFSPRNTGKSKDQMR